MGWKVRSDKLASVNVKVDEIGKRPQVRWKVVKYTIQKALITRGKTLEEGLNLEDIEHLIKEGILFSGSVIEMIKESGNRKFTMEEIREHFTSKYKDTITTFLDQHLNIEDVNDSATYDRFCTRKKAIKSETFKTICSCLGFDYREVGRDEAKVPEYHKELETLLWKLNHQEQITRFQELAQDSHNLVCLKFSEVPETKIPIYWLIQTLVQPFEGKLEQFKIELNSNIESNYKKGLNIIVDKFDIRSKLKGEKTPDAIAREIHKKILKKKETTVLLFSTEERRNLSDCDQLVNQLYQSLRKLFCKQKPNHKLLMVWIDSLSSSQWESNAFDLDDYDNFMYTEIPISSRFHRSDIIEWTTCNEVRSFIDKNPNILSNNLDLFENQIGEISNESQEVEAESLLRYFYSSFDLDLECYESVWQNKI